MAENVTDDRLVEMDIEAARKSKADRVEAVLYAYWLTATYSAHFTPMGYLNEEGEACFKSLLTSFL